MGFYYMYCSGTLEIRKQSYSHLLEINLILRNKNNDLILGHLMVKKVTRLNLKEVLQKIFFALLT
jgi:hypothetical protein